MARSCSRLVGASVVALALLFVIPNAPASHTNPELPAAPPGSTTASSGPASMPTEVAPAFSAAVGDVALAPLPASTPLEVAVGLASKDPEGLAAWVRAITTPGTPVFGRSLSAAVADSRFGANLSAVRAAETYFSGFGLSTSANPDGLLVDVEGPGSEIARAFGTQFETFRLPSGRVVFTHTSPAMLPAVAPWTGVFGLGNVTPMEPSSLGSGAGPLSAPSAGSCASLAGALAPCQIDRAYDIDPLLSAGENGTGIRIGVIDAYSGNQPQATLQRDLSAFANGTGLSIGNVSYLYPVPAPGSLNASGVNPGWSDEDPLDLEWARAAAPGASIDMTFSPNAGAGLYVAIDWLVSHRSVDVLSMSWGEPDVGIYNAWDMPCSSACNASTDGSYGLLEPVLELGAAEGISAFAASGDCGSADGTSVVSTNYPASDPYATGVGGTLLNVQANGTYVSETGWAGNESGASNPGCYNGGGSGGGFAPFPRPGWQVGAPSSPSGRGVPDVSLDAQTPAALVIGGGWTALSGTSLATPIWAGIAAIADQAAGHDLGLLNPSLYRIAAGAQYSTDFHDILTGTNGYSAGTGWDPVTGLGSPIVASLVGGLARAGSLTPGLRSVVYATPRFGAAPLTATFGLSVSGGTGTYPIEGIYFGDGNASPLLGSLVEHTFTAPGVYSVQSYAVDSQGNSTISPPVLVVVGGGGSLAVSLNISSTAPAVNATITLTALASGGRPPYRYNFSFGDGSYSDGLTTASVTHAYPQAGGFCAEVVVVDNASPPDGGTSPRVGIGVGGAPAPGCGNPTAPLTVVPAPPNGTRDAPADFPALFRVAGGSSGPVGANGTRSYSSDDPYVSACQCTIFRNPGNFTVALTATDAVSQAANGSTTVVVAPPLVGTFAASTLAGPVPLKVEFFSKSTGGVGANASTTHWTFGNGYSAVGHSENATYYVPGEYLAVGVLTDAGHGNTSEAFLVDAEPDSASPPVGMTATISPATNVSSGTKVHFSGAIVGPASQTDLDTLAWDLGGNFSAFGPSFNQTYTAPVWGMTANALVARLSVEDADLLPVVSTPIVLAPFFAVEAGGFIPAEDALALSSAVAPPFGLTPLAIRGTANAAGPGIVQIEWSFDDGTPPVISASVGHVYYGIGPYTVKAVANDSFGDRDVDLSGVVATGPLGIAGGPAPTGGPPPLPIAFSAAAYGGAGPPYGYAWTMGPTALSNHSSFNLTFGGIGRYVVTLTVTDRSGEQFNRSWTIAVAYPIPLTAGDVFALGAGAGILLAVVAMLADRRRRRRATPSQPPSEEDVLLYE